MDIQGFIHIPGGGVIPILELSAIAIVHTPNGDFFNGPIFSHTFGASEPDGVYMVRLVFRDSATKETVAVVTKAFSR